MKGKPLKRLVLIPEEHRRGGVQRGDILPGRDLHYSMSKFTKQIVEQSVRLGGSTRSRLEMLKNLCNVLSASATSNSQVRSTFTLVATFVGVALMRR